MNARFELALLSDLESIIRMMKPFYEHERLTPHLPAAVRALEALLFKPEVGKAFLLQRDGELAGYAIVTYGYSLEFGGQYCLLDELYVQDEHRKLGLAQGFLLFLEQWAKSQGAHALLLQVDRANSSARALYCQQGFGELDRHLLSKRLA